MHLSHLNVIREYNESAAKAAWKERGKGMTSNVLNI